jgi:epoxyqueuosine reductase
MAYMLEPKARDDPRALMPEARSIIVVALPHAAAPLSPRPIAAYAQGNDYHRVIKSKLQTLADTVSKILGHPIKARACVDSAPLLEREAAMRAGIAFIGKSTMAIVAGLGSYVLLGELLVDAEIEPSAPAAPRCGRCTICLDACPTAALVQPYVLDASRCLSQLTIEHRGALPRELRSAVGSMVFGCDICQRVCPYNAAHQDRPGAPELSPRQELAQIDLISVLLASSSAHRRLIRGTALSRLSRNRLARNAAVALGNLGGEDVRWALCQALAHPSPMVRGHAAWSLGQLGGASDALAQQATSDADAWVREEASAALAHSRSSSTTTGA